MLKTQSAIEIVEKKPQTQHIIKALKSFLKFFFNTHILEVLQWLYTICFFMSQLIDSDTKLIYLLTKATNLCIMTQKIHLWTWDLVVILHSFQSTW